MQNLLNSLTSSIEEHDTASKYIYKHSHSREKEKMIHLGYMFHLMFCLFVGEPYRCHWGMY